MLTDSEIDHQRTAEVVAAQAAGFADLSRRYAARGDTRRAALAIWAADIRIVQAVLWESGLSAAPDPAQQIRDVAGAVERALAAALAAADPAPTVRTVLETARRGLLDAFDPSVHDLLTSRFADLAHLEGLPAVAPGAANQAVLERLDGRSGDRLKGDLLTSAQDCRAVEGVMREFGDNDEAGRQSTAADLAGFDAYLVMASAASGDATLATTELRWDLAARAAEASGPLDGAALAAATREAVRSAVLPAEDDALLYVLDLDAPGPAQAAG